MSYFGSTVDNGSPPAATGYGLESERQRLLAAQPALLPGVGEDDRAVTEFGTRVGPSDIVAVGIDGRHHSRGMQSSPRTRKPAVKYCACELLGNLAHAAQTANANGQEVAVSTNRPVE